MEATRNEQQPFVYGSLSRRAIYLTGQPSAGLSTNQANAAPTDTGALSRVAPSSLAIDPALVGTWEIMVPSDRGMSRWIWRIMVDGTYKFRAEGPRAAPAHGGTTTAMNGHWSIHANRGRAG